MGRRRKSREQFPLLRRLSRLVLHFSHFFRYIESLVLIESEFYYALHLDQFFVFCVLFFCNTIVCLRVLVDTLRRDIKSSSGKLLQNAYRASYKAG